MTAAASSSSSASTSTITITPSPDIKVPSCNLCSTSFQNALIQRQHMKEPWHVYNIKRRMVSLPPISLHVFESRIQKEQEEASAAARKSSKYSSSEENDSDDDDDDSQQSNSTVLGSSESIPEEDGEGSAQTPPPSPFNTSTCIFCPNFSSTLSQNLSHMSLSHNFHIPNQAHLTDLESFLGYIATVVLHYHECLFCRCQKHSVQGIRQHMTSKGHTIVNLDKGSEFLEFWDNDSSSSEEEVTTSGGKKPQAQRLDVSGNYDEDDDVREIKLASGGVARSNHHYHGPRRNGTCERQVRYLARRRAKATPTTASRDTPKPVLEDSQDDGSGKEKKGTEEERQHHSHNSRRLAVKKRGELGMIGVSEQQKRALVAVERKMLKREIVDIARQRWGVEKVANRQKCFKNDVPGRSNG